jgi:thiol-disulfide isomerase/thioredoxin
VAINRMGFTIGLVTGIALTFTGLNVWGKYLDRTILDAAQPQILRPMRLIQKTVFPVSTTNLPAAWLPEVSSRQHDSWTARTLDGREVRLGDFKGNVVFLNFWSTTCAPCIEEMAGIESLLDSVKNERVAFLAVTQEGDSVVREFLKKHPLRIPVYLSSENLPPDLLPLGVPTTFILDTRGAAVLRHIGPVNWDDDGVREYIRGLLKKEG